tara:strand:- start:1004 stop:1480 length:477 start_codon:yes stop_codon:yes gene_type:complete
MSRTPHYRDSFTKNQVAQFCIEEFWEGYFTYAPYSSLEGDEEFWVNVIKRYDGWRFHYNLTNKFAENLCIEFLFKDLKEQPYDWRDEDNNPSNCWLHHILWSLYQTFGTRDIKKCYYEHWDNPDKTMDIIDDWRTFGCEVFDKAWEEKQKKIHDAGLK